MKIYDELLDTVDPDARHITWLLDVCNNSFPINIADIGAGTGRVSQGIRDRFPTVDICAIEPDRIFFKNLLDRKINAINQTIQEYSQYNSNRYDFAFVTYGGLQYVRKLTELQLNLNAVHRILSRGGRFAGEFYSSEVYSSLDGEWTVPILLDSEIWNLTMNAMPLRDGTVRITSTVERKSDGTVGEMVETIFPLSELQCKRIFKEAGFEEIIITSNGAFYRCVGKNLRGR